ncbi:endothelial differentiation-related factor 1 homolog isoform X1 [Chiloscyllium plagiosum]|uniref:endothelial differentiation-related factor 1 homolog isoform X1 n=1 Tax=Chiloscyllium plagiosum TaxID=36176 RepID=UPI001CB84AB8|nr:endothelial differentiation-related factor 1 homolog isoform X1 [Chiloscyllium plagiosum]
MAESDWDTVTVLRKKGPSAAQAKSKQAVTLAQRRGEDVETTKKWSAGQNKQHTITKNTAKLDRETEELHHERVSLTVGKLIQQGRQNLGMNQKDLATASSCEGRTSGYPWRRAQRKNEDKASKSVLSLNWSPLASFTSQNGVLSPSIRKGS